MSDSETYFPSKNEKPPLGLVGAYLGMSGAIIAMLIFTAGCFGYQQVFSMMPYVPMFLGSVGMVLSLIGGFCAKYSGMDDTQIFLAIFASFIAMGGAFLELSVGHHWSMFYVPPTGN